MYSLCAYRQKYKKATNPKNALMQVSCVKPWLRRQRPSPSKCPSFPPQDTMSVSLFDQQQGIVGNVFQIVTQAPEKRWATGEISARHYRNTLSDFFTKFIK
jgi:hypothetical protein